MFKRLASMEVLRGITWCISNSVIHRNRCMYSIEVSVKQVSSMYMFRLSDLEFWFGVHFFNPITH